MQQVATHGINPAKVFTPPTAPQQLQDGTATKPRKPNPEVSGLAWGIITLMEEKHRWSRADTARALGFRDGGGLSFYLTGASQEMPTWRRLRVAELRRVAEEHDKLFPPSQSVPRGVPLSQALARPWNPAELQAAPAASRPNRVHRGTTQELLDRARAYLERAAGCLEAAEGQATRLLKPGIADLNGRVRELAAELEP